MTLRNGDGACVVAVAFAMVTQGTPTLLSNKGINIGAHAKKCTAHTTFRGVIMTGE